MAKGYVGKSGVIGVALMARACSRGANLPAVWFATLVSGGWRCRASLQNGSVAQTFDDAVYRMAATITMSSLQLDQEAFVQQLRCETPALNSSLR
jgi:hypothetical protein